MCYATEGCFNAAQNYGYIGEELFKDVGIDNGGIFRAQVVATIGAVSIFGAQTTVGRVFIDHGVHAARSDGKKQARPPQLFEIAEVAVPVRLRYDANPIAFCFEQAADDSRAEGRMVHVGIAGKNNDVGCVPSAQIHLFAGGGQPVGELRHAVGE